MHLLAHPGTHLSCGHNENFPVASFLLPRHLRHPIRLIYRFARQADDFADEGNLMPTERLALLEDYRHHLDCIRAGQTPESPLFRELAQVIRARQLPVEAFYDLLDAFSQDVLKNRYADFGELVQYCRRSANPVGRLLLHLFNAATPRNMGYSDAICTALQLINFLQDIAVDYRKGRIYLPQDELAAHGMDEAQIARGDAGGPWAEFMLFQVLRARRLLQSGAPLGQALEGRAGMEMRMIIAGGETILHKIQRAHGDVFRYRPCLNPADWGAMLYRAVRA